VHLKRLKWAGHVVRALDIRTTKHILKEVSEKEDQLENQGIDEKANCGRMPAICSV